MVDVNICPICGEIFAEHELCKCERKKTGQLTSEDMEWMDLGEAEKLDEHLNRLLEMLTSMEKTLRLMIWQQEQKDANK